MKKPLGMLLGVTIATSACSSFNMRASGLLNADSPDNSPAAKQFCENIKGQDFKGQIITFAPNQTFNFRPANAISRELYISNHDQHNPKKIGFVIEGVKNLTLDFRGSSINSFGTMISLVIKDCENVKIKNLSIDAAEPQIADLKFIKCDKSSGNVTAKVMSTSQWRIAKNGRFELFGENFTEQGHIGIAFEGKTFNMVPNCSDLGFPGSVTKIDGETISFNNKKLASLGVGTRFALRTWHRPSPGIVLDNSKNTIFENVTVTYSEGMALLAQRSENITLKKFSVIPPKSNDGTKLRCFSSQADATHFSGCKGKIISENGFYENMMDDAINVHGTYLKVAKRIDDHTVEAFYAHGQAYGFQWGDPEDKVQFVRSRTMEIEGGENSIVSLKPLDKPDFFGAKRYELKFKNPVPQMLGKEPMGIENLTWTPSVVFRNNYISSNRARGALFSTPSEVIIEGNVFDRTSGCAILLCGDCNGWYETGACKNVKIRKNKFINAMTCSFQFTNGIISIHPEIPNIKEQKKYFHTGIEITDNHFETFGCPLVYAKSVDGILWARNTVKVNNDFPLTWQAKTPFWLERCKNVKLKFRNEPKWARENFRLNLMTKDDISIK